MPFKAGGPVIMPYHVVFYGMPQPNRAECPYCYNCTCNSMAGRWSWQWTVAKRLSHQDAT